jgi:hypothetical protein
LIIIGTVLVQERNLGELLTRLRSVAPRPVPKEPVAHHGQPPESFSRQLGGSANGSS